MYQPGKRMSVAHDVLRLPRVPRPLRAVGFVVLLVLLLPYVLTLFYAFGEPVSTVMLWRRMTGQRVERMYVPLARMSSSLPLAVIAAEDGRFCEHYGVDLAGIRDAINQADDLDDIGRRRARLTMSSPPRRCDARCICVQPLGRDEGRPQSHSLPPTPRSNHRPRTRGSRITSAMSAWPMW